MVRTNSQTITKGKGESDEKVFIWNVYACYSYVPCYFGRLRKYKTNRNSRSPGCGTWPETG